MDAKFSHVRVSSPASPQAEQLHQRAIDWPSAMEAAAPVITGEPLPSGMTPPETVPEYPVYLVSVPASFAPDSWHTVPPGANHYPSGEVAAEVVAVMNRAIIRASRDGGVSRWYIRLRKSTGGASISVSLKEPFFPRSEYDMPPAFMTMRGQVMQWKGVIADLNERLSRAENNKGKVMRAYVAHSIRPDELRPIPTGDQPEAESVSSGGDAGPQIEQAKNGFVSPKGHNVPSGDPAPKQHQPGSIYLVDVPSDYEPFNWKSLPGSFQKVKDKQAAKDAAVGQNRRLLGRSAHGIVYAWYIVVTAPKSYGIVQVNIPAGWRPIDAYDMPEPMTVIHEKKRRKESVTKLNQQLDRDHSKGRKRAYVAIPIERPEAIELPPVDATGRQAVSDIEAGFMRCGHFQTDTSQQNGNGHSRLLDHLQAMNR
ncbi:hypothetical protein F1728_00150 [Gimesia benthica]|uniref:Uncharacterized protein n=1 Tax=Gimesia benthica TaxID=2608982 RepID=A0A6I6A7T3_9PLAN|nr:hypothetical protein [Gimesia benthica]QGQ21211.1 hypothetical protein F1728_00150 [Gimesia benthica]